MCWDVKRAKGTRWKPSSTLHVVRKPAAIELLRAHGPHGRQGMTCCISSPCHICRGGHSSLISCPSPGTPPGGGLTSTARKSPYTCQPVPETGKYIRSRQTRKLRKIPEVLLSCSPPSHRWTSPFRGGALRFIREFHATARRGRTGVRPSSEQQQRDPRRDQAQRPEARRAQRPGSSDDRSGAA